MEGDKMDVIPQFSELQENNLLYTLVDSGGELLLSHHENSRNEWPPMLLEKGHKISILHVLEQKKIKN